MREIRTCLFVFVLEQIMTSFPVYGDLLLSPLSHDLIDLSEKEKLMKDYRSMPVSRGGLESLNTLPNGSDSRKADGTVVIVMVLGREMGLYRGRNQTLICWLVRSLFLRL